MLEWDKGKDIQHISLTNHISDMEGQMDTICSILSEETQKFESDMFFSKICEYVDKNERLLYTNITNYIFELDDQAFGILQTNIDSVIEYMYSSKYEQDVNSKLKDKYQKRVLERTQRTILKMWDHINLARRQYIMFYHNDKDYEKIVDSKMETAEIKMSKEMNAQLIALVGIFTALSFLVFGGVSSLDNIFLGAKDIPVLKLIIIGCIWCFCIMNLVYVFMFFIAKLTKLSMKSVDDVNANIIQRYPLIVWSNFVIVSTFLMVCWIYYIRRYEYSKDIDDFISGNPTFFSFLGIAVIIVIVSIIASIIYKMWKKE